MGAVGVVGAKKKNLFDTLTFSPLHNQTAVNGWTDSLEALDKLATAFRNLEFQKEPRHLYIVFRRPIETQREVNCPAHLVRV